MAGNMNYSLHCRQRANGGGTCGIRELPIPAAVSCHMSSDGPCLSRPHGINSMELGTRLFRLGCGTGHQAIPDECMGTGYLTRKVLQTG